MLINSFANYLVVRGLIAADVVEKAISDAELANETLISYLMKAQLLSYKTLAESIADYFQLPLLNISQLEVANLPLAVLDKRLILKHYVLPLAKTANGLSLALTDPTQPEMLNEIKFHTNLTIKPVIAEFDKLINVINTIFQGNKYQLEDNEDYKTIEIVNQILTDAIARGSSDIHIEPRVDSCRIRFRVDGLLYEVLNLDLNLCYRIVTRIKIMAGLDIAEKRLPQDGRFNLNLMTNKSFDCRVSSCPTLHGEKLVVRILNPAQAFLKVIDLGLETEQLKIFLKCLKKPQGLILVTGPTGSGKTITLYAALNELNDIAKNISTVEDPIEINLPGINQVNINSKIGLEFATILRAFMRQDPDIIMVGEIRDSETAEIAIKAAQTGHLVLATLHTNSAVEAIARLQSIGIQNYNLLDSLLLIIAQRLVRKLCPQCKKPQELSTQILLAEGFTESEFPGIELYSADGCEDCNHGFKGRTGIFEVLPISENFINLIVSPRTKDELLRAAIEEGMLTLRRAALNKVRQGVTTMAEINRIT